MQKVQPLPQALGRRLGRLLDRQRGEQLADEEPAPVGGVDRQRVLAAEANPGRKPRNGSPAMGWHPRRRGIGAPETALPSRAPGRAAARAVACGSRAPRRTAQCVRQAHRTAPRRRSGTTARCRPPRPVWWQLRGRAAPRALRLLPRHRQPPAAPLLSRSTGGRGSGSSRGPPPARSGTRAATPPGRP